MVAVNGATIMSGTAANLKAKSYNLNNIIYNIALEIVKLENNCWIHPSPRRHYMTSIAISRMNNHTNKLYRQ